MKWKQYDVFSNNDNKQPINNENLNSAAFHALKNSTKQKNMIAFLNIHLLYIVLFLNYRK